MAFYTNNSNVGKLCAVKNDKVMVCDLSLPSETSTILDGLKDLKAEDAEETPEKSKALASDVFKVNCVAISTCCKYLSASTSLNCLLLWKLSEDKWNLCSSRSLIRKGQKLIFTNSSFDIIIADRGGDIFQYSAKDFKEKGKFLLGHICLVLDMAISPDDKLLASCDRDGKIKISHYPNAYNILAYCLGHQEFVSSIQFIQLSGRLSLISSSGDGTIRLWRKEKNWSEHFSLILCENDSLCEKSDAFEGDNGNKSNTKIVGASGYLVSENQIQFSVRCIKYYNKQNLCLILFHLKPVVAVFKLSEDGSIEFKQLLTLPGNPLDAVLCSDEKLLILVKQLENVLVLFNYSEEQMFTQEKSEKIPQFFREFYQEFSCVDAFTDDFVALFKRCYDTTDENEHDNSKKKKCM